MNKIKTILLSAATIFALNGCLMTSPYWNQEFDTRTELVPLQSYTGDKSVNVVFQCAKAFHGGLYPFGGPVVWTTVASVKPGQALLDSFGQKVFGAGKKVTLPAGCWRKDSNNLWYSAIRATQNKTVIGTDQKYFHTFDKTGLICLGRENGTALHWLGWYSAGCQTNAYYAIFRAKA